MSKYFNGDKLSGYEDSPITYVYGGNLEECHKVISDLEAKLAEKQSKIQELNDIYEDLLCAKGTEHELKQVKEDVEMLNERNLCLFSLLYETLEKQGCENITSTIEQMTNLHLNKCSHWYKNNRVCDELEKQLAEKAEQVKQLKLDLGMFKSVNEFLNSYGIEKAREVLLQTEKTKNQDKISFAVEQLNATYRLLNDKAICVTGTGVNAVRLYTINEVFKNQIEQLNASISMPLEEKESE